MTPAIAIVGVACRYPDARSPQELWENVLAQRRAFRRIPPQRLRLADYLSSDRSAPDRTYSTEAALLADYEFDRVSYRVAARTVRAADVAHWLALEVAGDALTDAGFPGGAGLPRQTTGVLLGNTLTGEFSRASTLRLRWPYVRRVAEATLAEAGAGSNERRALLGRLETAYKQPFPPVTEETLAGGLSNTIAGRICNHFDLKGGGYTVDGACASSLLATVSACTSIASGDLDVALAGGVDLSLDPFELVGFAKTGALALDDMRIYDARSQGFWPGEGCGFVVLMRAEDALRDARRVYAVIRGWGISSDGSGGLTRPDVDGQLLAMRRAYRRAGCSADAVAFVEGHGTGTEVGDATEIRALVRARRDAAPDPRPAVLGSIKANIGHTKAAAGIAGLIKATLALDAQVLPATTGCHNPHPELAAAAPALGVLRKGDLWPADWPLRAAVSSMGFGGINAHVVLEGAGAPRRRQLTAHERRCVRSPQDAELLLFSAPSAEALQAEIEDFVGTADRLSRAELADLSVERLLNGVAGPYRAAFVASTPMELTQYLAAAVASVDTVDAPLRGEEGGAWVVGRVRPAPKVGFLFPGQGSPTYRFGGAWARRFDEIEDLYRASHLSSHAPAGSTAFAQPAIVLASLAALRVLDHIGLAADVALGHSLGELAAMHWAGAMDESSLLRIVTERGRIMATHARIAGAMASVAAPLSIVEPLVARTPVVVAAVNSPRQTVISGPAADLEAIAGRARQAGLHVTRLPVSYAFHSPLMEPSASAFREYLATEALHPVSRRIVSTVTGERLTAADDYRAILHDQVTRPVRFFDAFAAASPVDLFIEAGPGQALSAIATDLGAALTVPLDAGGDSLRGLLRAVGVAFVIGAPIDVSVLARDRFTRPFKLPGERTFLSNPCEHAPVLDEAPSLPALAAEDDVSPAAVDGRGGSAVVDVVALVLDLVSSRTELPLTRINIEHRLLSDLHLNSITVSEMVLDATRKLGVAPMNAPTELANATVAQVAQALTEHASAAARVSVSESTLPIGVDAWVRAFTVERRSAARPPQALAAVPLGWDVFATADHPLRESLERAFERCPGGGVVACVSARLKPKDAVLLLRAAQSVSKRPAGARFVAVQQGGGAAALAKTLFLEAPWITTCVVDVPFDAPAAVAWILAEALAADGFAEVQYDRDGHRSIPVLRPLVLPDAQAGRALESGEVVLVTGGGKGIAAECALALARDTGAKLAILGRSDPAVDEVLASNLDRMRAAGALIRYLVADIRDSEAVARAVRDVERVWGPPIAVLHAAGINAPALIEHLDEEALFDALAPKMLGATHLLKALDPTRLRVFVTFGSLTARTGMKGDAHYALANEWLSCSMSDWQAVHTSTRFLAIEWSVWSGIGMGERMGRLESLARQGITAITPDEGMAMFRRLLAAPTPGAVVVSGRFGSAPTLRMDPVDLPLWRFLETTRVHVPGVELVVDARLSPATDLYLDDHVLHGERLLPAVLGLEAMAQAATALTGVQMRCMFRDITFERPIVIGDRDTVIRIAALVRSPQHLTVAIRSEVTSFQIDHFRAECIFESPAVGADDIPADALPDMPAIDVDPDRDLYGAILFQQGRFHRVTRYRQLTATACEAEVRVSVPAGWFADYVPGALLLGDPGARDAALHAVQACIPHMRVVPVSVASVELLAPWSSPGCIVHAQEIDRDELTLTYDLDIRSVDGRPVERWRGLTLRRIEPAPSPSRWSAPLLAAYVERRLGELHPTAELTVFMGTANAASRQVRSARAIRAAAGAVTDVRWRPDGRPEADGSAHVSVAHAGATTMAVAGGGVVACDIEPITARETTTWRALLGEDRFALAGMIATQAHEDGDAAATRIWAAAECLKKAGLASSSSLARLTARADGWVMVGADGFVIETFVAPVGSIGHSAAIAVLLRTGHADL